MLETVDHFLFHCEKYKTERDRMERTVENVLFREGCTDITCIDLRPGFFWPVLTTDIRSCSQCQKVCFFPNLNKKIPNSRNKKKREKK